MAEQAALCLRQEGAGLRPRQQQTEGDLGLDRRIDQEARPDCSHTGPHGQCAAQAQPTMALHPPVVGGQGLGVGPENTQLGVDVGQQAGGHRHTAAGEVLDAGAVRHQLGGEQRAGQGPRQAAPRGTWTAVAAAAARGSRRPAGQEAGAQRAGERAMAAREAIAAGGGREPRRPTLGGSRAGLGGPRSQRVGRAGARRRRLGRGGLGSRGDSTRQHGRDGCTKKRRHRSACIDRGGAHDGPSVGQHLSRYVTFGRRTGAGPFLPRTAWCYTSRR